MKENRMEEGGRLSDRGEGIGTVTEKMVRQRAREIAVINGRSANQLMDSDIEQALREMEGDERLTAEPTAADGLAEGERWGIAPQSVGHVAETMMTPDEQTFAEKLVDEGVADAEHDQEIEATRESLRREKYS